MITIDSFSIKNTNSLITNDTVVLKDDLIVLEKDMDKWRRGYISTVLQKDLGNGIFLDGNGKTIKSINTNNQGSVFYIDTVNMKSNKYGTFSFDTSGNVTGFVQEPNFDNTNLTNYKLYYVARESDDLKTNLNSIFNQIPGQTITSDDVYSHIITTHVTTMSELFKDNLSFNQDIRYWDTRNVTNMYSMFNGATTFNQNISIWDTSKVINIRYMFNGATSFNQIFGPDSNFATGVRTNFSENDPQVSFYTNGTNYTGTTPETGYPKLLSNS